MIYSCAKCGTKADGTPMAGTGGRIGWPAGWARVLLVPIRDPHGKELDLLRDWILCWQCHDDIRGLVMGSSR